MLYEISEKQKENLIAFLTRSTLHGGEVPQYVEIMNILSNPVKLKDE